MDRLTAAELQRLEAELRRRAGELREQVDREAGQTADADFAEGAGTVTDVGDEANADLRNDTEHAMHSQHLGELMEVEQARRRIADGDYGVCVDCGRAIDVRRLRASPAAARCLACQERQEQGAGAPHPHTL